MEDKIKSQGKKKEKLNKLEIGNLLNADYEGLARGEKKAFLSTQCKDTEENSRMGKTRDVFKRDTKGIFHSKMGIIKDKNGMYLTGVEDIKNTQKNYTKNILHDPDNHDCVITHLEPDILECKVN